VSEFRWAAISDPGQLREINQDSAFATDRVFVVADGMGGHNGGEVASRWAAMLIHERLVAGADGEDPATNAAPAVLWANSVIHAQAAHETELSGMGTTVCALIVDPKGTDTKIINVGDSRGYRLRDGALSQVTEDHSLVETLVREGRLRAEDAIDHPQRNIVTRALGVESKVEVDEFVIEPVAGDRYLLCSDGLSNELSDPEIEEVLGHNLPPGETIELMVDMANAAGGHDNITCVLIDVIDPDAETDGATASEASAATFVGSVLDENGDLMAMPDVSGIDLDNETARSLDMPESSPDDGDRRSDNPTDERPVTKADASDRSTETVQSPVDRKAWRVPAGILALLAVVAIGAGFVLNSSDSVYYLGFDNDGLVAIFEDDGGIFPGGDNRVMGLDVTMDELDGVDVEMIENRDFEGTLEEMRERLNSFDTVAETGDSASSDNEEAEPDPGTDGAAGEGSAADDSN